MTSCNHLYYLLLHIHRHLTVFVVLFDWSAFVKKCSAIFSTSSVHIQHVVTLYRVSLLIHTCTQNLFMNCITFTLFCHVFIKKSNMHRHIKHTLKWSVDFQNFVSDNKSWPFFLKIALALSFWFFTNLQVTWLIIFLN